ncbi:MAG: monovalent cation/H(+) antiporter subunit G [Nitrospiraceae bacterium]
MSVVVVGLILLGLFFLVTAAIGMIRLPDVFTRSHAVALTDSLGAFLVLSGLAIHQGPTLNAVKTFLVLVLIFLLNPVIAHATMRAALRSGIKPWTRADRPVSAGPLHDREQRSTP